MKAGPRLWLLALLSLFLLLVDLWMGPVRIPPEKLFAVLLGSADNPVWKNILLVFRLPKLLTALAAGAALSVSGLILQTVFRNPLAGPDSLGIGAGASIGVAFVVLVLGSAGSSQLLPSMGLSGYVSAVVAASLGAGLVMGSILLVARRVANAVTLLIVGLLVGYLAASMVSILVYFGSPEKTQVYLGWTYGSFSGVTLAQLPVLYTALFLGLGLALTSTKALNALVMGEGFAESLGIEVRAARTKVLLSAALLSGAATAFCGPIAFLGIAAPQAARRTLKSSDHRILLPASALWGSIFALSADIASQLPGQGAVLPINPLLALVGAPLILGMLLRGSRAAEASR